MLKEQWGQMGPGVFGAGAGEIILLECLWKKILFPKGSRVGDCFKRGMHCKKTRWWGGCKFREG